MPPRIQNWQDPAKPVMEVLETVGPSTNLTVNSLTVTTDASIGDDLAVTDDVTIGGDTLMTGTLGVGGNITAGQSINAATGAVNALAINSAEDMTCGRNLVVNGNTTLGNALADQTNIAGTCQISGDASVAGEFVSSGLATMGQTVISQLAIGAGTLSGTFPAVADATDLPSAITAINTIMGYLRTRGDMAP